MTCHRRENYGQPMQDIMHAILEVVNSHPDVEVVYPVHLSPVVRECAFPILGGHERIHLIDPVNAQQMHNLMSRCYMVMTDSGGLQEEAPALGKPVLVMRRETERPEAIAAGTAKLAGVEKDTIVKLASELLDDPEAYAKMGEGRQPLWRRPCQRAHRGRNFVALWHAGRKARGFLRRISIEPDERRRALEQEHKNLKPLLLAATAAVTVIAILLVFFFSGRKSESTQTIILPDPPAQEQAPDEEQPEASLAELTRENVQSVLKKSVARPSSYHQSMQIVITSGDIQRTQTAELWVKGELVKAQITDELETKTILADATTLYVWYDDEAPVQMARGAGMRTVTLRDPDLREHSGLRKVADRAGRVCDACRAGRRVL